MIEIGVDLLLGIAGAFAVLVKHHGGASIAAVIMRRKRRRSE
jgi:hypothetical protein